MYDIGQGLDDGQIEIRGLDSKTQMLVKYSSMH